MIEPTPPSAPAAPAPPPLTAPAESSRPPAPAASPAHQPLTWLVLLLALALPPLFFTENRLGTFNRYLALAILALGIDLIWGYTGLLSLGQGVFFGLGAYCVALSLTMQKYQAELDTRVTDFMERGGYKDAPPEFIEPLFDIWLALGAAVLLPMVVAAVFGMVTFRQGAAQATVKVALLGVAAPFALGFGATLFLGYSFVAATVVGSLVAALSVGVTSRVLARLGVIKGTEGRARIQGVYFSLITQALLLVAFLWARNQQAITGGVNGIHELAKLNLAGITFRKPWQLYCLIAPALLLCLLALAGLMRSKFGQILAAIRDNENRVLALGYSTAMYKVCAFTLAGALAGLAGALYVPANGATGPTDLSTAFSITMVIWVAVGGRGTLVGAVVGTILVNFAESYLSSAAPEYWPIVLGLLFIGVVVFLPRGILGVAGPGALLGAVLGVGLVDAVERILNALAPGGGLPKPARVVAVSLFVIGMVFVPKGLAWLARRATAAVRPPGRGGLAGLQGQATA